MNILSGGYKHAYRGSDILDWCFVHQNQTHDRTKARIARNLVKSYTILPDEYYYVTPYEFYHTHRRFMVWNASKLDEERKLWYD